MGTLERQWQESLLDGDNYAYLETVYEQYLEDPGSVSAAWREYFQTLPRVNGQPPGQEPLHSQIRAEFENFSPANHDSSHRTLAAQAAFERKEKQVHVLQLINAYRFLGHLYAQTNPLGDYSSPHVPSEELSLDKFKLSKDDLESRFNSGSLAAPAELPLADIIAQLQKTYCGSIGIEYMHIPDTQEKRWIQQRLESVHAKPTYSANQKRAILERLTSAEVLERYLHSKYVGQKRFSLEGAESLIPLLDDLIQSAGSSGLKEIVIGMAHRGRLNVLVNILGKSPALLFQEFEGSIDHQDITGDVKYHQGFSSNINTPGGPVHLAMAFNPSHLEIVGPVVEGSVRARQDRLGDGLGDQVLPIVIHGDASFAGQGVVMESLNMSDTRGFSSKGTVHIIINNQIGFTTSIQRDARSTYYSSDVAKIVNAPILHVNGDDPEAVVFTAQLALDYRMRFRKDVVIDLVCYRRQGHNEADEPAVTQPRMYRKIRQLPTTRSLYERQLVNERVITQNKAHDIGELVRHRLDEGQPMVPHLLGDIAARQNTPRWKNYLHHHWWEATDTGIERDRLPRLTEVITHVPEDFVVHPRVEKIIQSRAKMGRGEIPVDWGFGEMLAYASLLQEGYPVRLTGQDSGRGTFFHRHAVLHEQETGVTYVPLRQLRAGNRNFQITDSLLSEEAVLAFEYGYATTEPDSLVVWEAQFGDFANGAQVVIDQFISSGEQKWRRLCGLCLFLPHGYEGQGPEHSSARLERYLQLCAQQNIQICIPSTPAQMFHLLRRQMLRPYRKPAIIMTPKSLLRHPLATSELEDFEQHGFRGVIPEDRITDPKHIDRVVLCSGKVYYDLITARETFAKDNVAIIRIEQLYPFPEKEFVAAMEPFNHVNDIVWCQEEPRNQGAWFSLQHTLRILLHEGVLLNAVTRHASASPAVGLLHVHLEQQKNLVASALGLDATETTS